MQCRLQFW